MDQVKLTWHIIREENLDENRILDLTKAVYMYVCARWDASKDVWIIDADKPPLYIGQVYDRIVRDRLKEHLNDEIRDCMEKRCDETILIKVAEVEPVTMNYVTQELLSDIECCLICKTQSTCNTRCKESYTGRDLEISNEGKKLPLQEKYVCYEGEKC